MIIYGISNCDTVRKARRWLEAEEIAHQFHDYRRDGVDEALVATLIAQVGLTDLINRRSAAWRALSDEVKANMDDPKVATAAILETPTLIKRPLLIDGDRHLLGFKAEQYADFCGK